MSRLLDLMQHRALSCTRVELMLTTALFGIVTAIAVIGLASPVHAERIADASRARIVDRSELAWIKGKLQVLIARGTGLHVLKDSLSEPMQRQLISGYDYRTGIRATRQLCGSAGPEAGSTSAVYKAASSAGELTCY